MLNTSADMKVSEQCRIAAANGNQILGLIRRNIVYKNELIIPLYKTIVRPHLEYFIQAWRPYRKNDIEEGYQNDTKNSGILVMKYDKKHVV